MQNYVKNSIRTLFAGLLLMAAHAVAENSDTPLLGQEALSMVTAQAHFREIFVSATRLDYADAAIFAYPSVYSLSTDQSLLLGAPKPGYYASSIVRVSPGYGVVSLVHKKASINGATSQANPVYNKQIIHLCAGHQSCVYAVTQDAPDTVYRYASYEKGGNASIHSHKITDPDGNPCSIERMTWGSVYGVEYIIAQVRSQDTSKGISFAFIKSYTKLIPPPAKPKLTLEQKEEAVKKKAQEDRYKTEEEIDAEKRAEEEKAKPTQRYMFTGVNPLTEEEEVTCAVWAQSLMGDEVKNVSSCQVTDIKIINNKLYMELCDQGTVKRMLLQGTFAKNHCSLKPVQSAVAYYRAVPKRQTWEREPSMCMFALSDRKRFSLVVGDMHTSSSKSCKQLLALPLGDHGTADSLVVGGSAVLPGPIADVKTEGETVFVCVATPDTDMLPGVFQSQAIIDEHESLAAWTPWQRVGGSTDSVLCINPNGLSLWMLSSSTKDSRVFRLNATRWRGTSLDKAEEKAREEAAKKRAEEKKEAENREKTLAAIRAEAEKVAAKSPQVVEKKKKKIEEEILDPVVISSSYFDVDMVHTKHQSSALSLSYFMEQLFTQDSGGIRSLCDVPATATCQASFVIAVGLKQILIAQLNQQFDDAKNKIIQKYEHTIRCTDGTLKALGQQEKNTEAIICSGGVLNELSYLDYAHMATNGTDTWLCVAGPLGVAILCDTAGKGLQAKTGFGNKFMGASPELSFKRLGSYKWIRAITSDDQFLYIVTEDSVDRIPLQRSSFADTGSLAACTIVTGNDIGAVCDGYVFNDVCVSHGMMLIATPCGLVATAPECDCRKVTAPEQLIWQQVQIPAASSNIARLVPISPTGHRKDVACKGQLYVVASSLFDETASVTRLFLNKENKISPISVVPDVRNSMAGSWLNYVHQITAFFTDGLNHLVARSRFEERTVDLALVPAAGVKRNSGTPQLAFSPDTLQVSSIMRTSATGTIFVTADDGIRINE